MNKDIVKPDTWNPLLLGAHPVFWPLRPSAATFFESFARWPELADFQQFLRCNENPVLTRSHHPLTIVPQDEKQLAFEDGYEQRVYLKGELQTRGHSWHDLFQVLVWNIFPETKAVINELHFNAIKSRVESSFPSRRSTIENTLTQFDECGALIISPAEDLLALIRHFDWHTLFWDRKVQTASQLKCIVFGHALYEKSIRPYIGMTAHCVLVKIPDSVFNLPTERLIPQIDPLLAELFLADGKIQAPQDLSPFPLLGFPGWHPDNGRENFYENTEYFRSGRKQKY